ncbi:MAG: signal peptidase [Actinomycetota bacterium]|nr:signal peptidase [Actinomycetota bacterium]
MKTAETETKPEPVTKPKTPKGNAAWGVVREIAGLLIVALVLSIIIKTFFFQAFFIPSASMEGTLMVGDRVLVEKLPYVFHDPRRGDIVVFSAPHPVPQDDRGLVGGFIHWVGEGIGVQRPENPDYIKRVIGLPGDTVWATGGHVFVNNVPLSEPYLTERTADFPKHTVPQGDLFVMGDNRNNSLDSRFSPVQGGLGYVPIDKVIGKAFVIVWPTNRWNTLGAG